MSIGVPPRRINEIVHGKRGSPRIRRSALRAISACQGTYPVTPRLWFAVGGT